MLNIERIYTTRGDNLYDADGIKCDKAWAVVIDSKIYWVDGIFANIDELRWRLERLGVGIMKCGKRWRWGLVDEFGSATMTNSITTISKHHDDIFTQGSTYMKKSVMNEEGGLWWDINDLISAHSTAA